MPAETFAELLDLELGRVTDETSDAPPAERGEPHTVAASSHPAFRSFVPFEIPFIGRPGAYGRGVLTGPAGTSTAGEACARLALESAAVSTTDFSLAELRSAFRQLAREHHPDRHPDASSAEAAQWSGTFAAVARRYRRLISDLASRH